MDSVPTELAETIQAGHIRRHPDINFDIAPSTAADKREPLSLHSPRLSDDDLINEIDDENDEGEDDIPYSVLRPVRKTHNLPPLPDLRFEQSYLRSISNADTWWKVLLITARDQVRARHLAFITLGHVGRSVEMWLLTNTLVSPDAQVLMPLAQGLIYNLLLCGWQQWNRNAKLHGNTAGSRVRRWWYGVNNWTIPKRKT